MSSKGNDIYIEVKVLRPSVSKYVFIKSKYQKVLFVLQTLQMKRNKRKIVDGVHAFYKVSHDGYN